MDWVKIAVVGGGVGVLDDQLENWDIRRGRTGTFKTATDIGRLAAVLGGYALEQWGGRWSKYGESLTTAAAPLLTKTLIRAVKTGIRYPVGNFTARRAFSGHVGVPVQDPSGGRIVVSST